MNNQHLVSPEDQRALKPDEQSLKNGLLDIVQPQQGLGGDWPPKQGSTDPSDLLGAWASTLPAKTRQDAAHCIS